MGRGALLSAEEKRRQVRLCLPPFCVGAEQAGVDFFVFHVGRRVHDTGFSWGPISGFGKMRSKNRYKNGKADRRSRRELAWS